MTCAIGRVPVPSTLADYGIGVEFEAGERALGDAFSAGLGSDAESRIATGWIMMLYAHELRIDWDSNWRCVAFARLPLETAENDSLTPGMYWDDMCRSCSTASGRIRYPAQSP